MTDNNNNTTTTGVDNASTQSKSNTTPKRITNNNATTTGVDNTTTAPAAAAANNNTNDNVVYNSPQPFTNQPNSNNASNNSNADKNNYSSNTANITPAAVTVLPTSSSTATPTSTLKPTILSNQYISKSNYKLPSLGDRKVGVSGGLVNKRRALLGHDEPTSSLEVIKQENKNLSNRNKKMSTLCVNLEEELKVKDAELESGIEDAIVRVTFLQISLH